MPSRTPTRKGSGRRRVSPKTKKKTNSFVATVAHSLVRARQSIRGTLGRQTEDVWGLVLVVASILVTLAFVDLAGPIGDGFSSGTRFLFGVWRFLLPVGMAAVGIALIIGRPPRGSSPSRRRWNHDVHRIACPVPPTHGGRGFPLEH